MNYIPKLLGNSHESVIMVIYCTEKYLFINDIGNLMSSTLSHNEKRVLLGIVAYPHLNDTELAELLDMPYSTLSTIRTRLKNHDYFRTVRVPMMQNLGAELLAVMYTFFNPAISVQQRVGITAKTIEIFEEIFYSVGETHKGFLFSIISAQGGISDFSFSRSFFIECTSVHLR